MSERSEPLRVVIADDQALVRTGFAMILAAEGIDVVGEAADGARAVDEVRRTRPDVVLMDIAELGPAALIEQVREAERSDPDGRRWPRHKRHDDATVAFCEFATP